MPLALEVGLVTLAVLIQIVSSIEWGRGRMSAGVYGIITCATIAIGGVLGWSNAMLS